MKAIEKECIGLKLNPGSRQRFACCLLCAIAGPESGYRTLMYLVCLRIPLPDSEATELDKCISTLSHVTCYGKLDRFASSRCVTSCLRLPLPARA